MFRTEFLFLNAQIPPSEDQQFQAYAAVVRALRGPADHDPHPRPGRRQARRLPGTAYLEANPCLGLRSLRLSLRDPGLFRPQLRAMLRASSLGDVRILFPLLTTLG